MPGEAIQVFAAEISHLVEEAFPTYEVNAKNGDKCRCFVAGIEPYLQLRIHEQGVDSLDAALTLALQIEQAHQASKVVLPSYSQQWTSPQAGSFAGAPWNVPASPSHTLLRQVMSKNYRSPDRGMQTDAVLRLTDVVTAPLQMVIEGAHMNGAGMTDTYIITLKDDHKSQRHEWR